MGNKNTTGLGFESLSERILCMLLYANILINFKKSYHYLHIWTVSQSFLILV